MRINVGTKNRVKRQAVENIFSRVYDSKVSVKQIPVNTGVPEQPFGEEVAKGAAVRARKALLDANFGVGVEAGLIWNEYLETHFDVQYCAIIDRSGKLTVGHGPGFVYPEKVLREVLSGDTVGEVMDRVSGEKNLGKKQGAIGYLTKGLLPRTELTEQAVLMALIPRIKEDLYV